MMLTKRSLIALVTVASILNAALGSKLSSNGHGVQTSYDQVYSYNDGNTYQGVERQNSPNQKRPNVVRDFITALRRTVSKLTPKQPADRQGVAGLTSAIQTAAIPLAVAGLAAGPFSDQIMNVLNPATTTAATTTTALDLCAAVTCSSDTAPTCDTGSGLCKCGSDTDCSTKTDSPRCGTLNGVTQCLCGASAGCGGSVHPSCLQTDKNTQATHANADASCFCTGDALGCTVTTATGYDASKGTCNSTSKQCAAS